MEPVTFTRDELEQLTISQMKSLIEYYGIPFSGRLKKDHIDVLVDYYNTQRRGPEQQEDEQPMSVRIRRIKEASNG